MLGEFLEAGIHNTGHGLIARVRGQAATGTAGGVMGSTISAIRDQVFWRWHRYIDDVADGWQRKLPPEPFTDAPNVIVRNTLDGATTPWASPDVILVRTRDLPAGRSPSQLARLGTSLFGGPKWGTDFGAAAAASGATQLQTISEIVTTMQSSTMADGRSVRTLTHEPFTYFLRVENKKTTASDVTIRLFLVPAARADDRRAWIEMDKFSATLPARAKTVLVRSDRDSSVIKRPAEDSPAAIRQSTANGRERAYCDCGWPYPLLVPRGTTGQGMEYRLLMMVTDAAIDRVPVAGHCGSMSFCGAVDRYPDTREMGYPFHRPFAGSPHPCHPRRRRRVAPRRRPHHHHPPRLTGARQMSGMVTSVQNRLRRSLVRCNSECLSNSSTSSFRGTSVPRSTAAVLIRLRRQDRL